MNRTVEDWKARLTSDDDTERAKAAEKPPEQCPQEVREALIGRLEDCEPLVRTCAAESLEAFPSGRVREALRSALASEQDSLSRGYLLLSLASMAEAVDLSILLQEFQHADSKMALAYACNAAFRGVRRVTHQLLCGLIQDDDPDTRLVANWGCWAVCAPDYVHETIQALSSRLALEELLLVRESIEEQLDDLRNIEPMVSSRLKRTGDATP